MTQKANRRSEVSGVFGKTRLERVIRFLIISVALAITVLVVARFFQSSLVGGISEKPVIFVPDTSEKIVKEEKEEEREETWEEKEERYAAEARAQLEARAKELGVQVDEDGRIIESEEDKRAREQKRRKRRVRRFRWGSPAEERGKIWNVPHGEGEQALATALLRVCMAEADGESQDCVGIWQVLKNIRMRSCSRGYIRRITECEEGGGETMLSTIRRAQPHILAVPTYKLRNARAGWIRNLETDCEMPKGWPHSENLWDAQYGSRRCPYTVELVTHLIKDKLPPSRPGHRLRWLPGRPITWGGRCETKRASCDDRIACARGLARIPGIKFEHNAFWCRVGSPGCRSDVEPICVALGYGNPRAGEENKQQQKQENMASEETKTASEPIATSEQHPTGA